MIASVNASSTPDAAADRIRANNLDSGGLHRTRSGVPKKGAKSLTVTGVNVHVRSDIYICVARNRC